MTYHMVYMCVYANMLISNNLINLSNLNNVYIYLCVSATVITVCVNNEKQIILIIVFINMMHACQHCILLILYH